MIDFDNTEVAFSSKSVGDLNKSYWMFKIIGWNWLIKIGPYVLKVLLPLYFPIPIIKNTIFKQFCGGESINDCNNTINELAKQNVKTILDYSVEGKEKESVFDNNVLELLNSIEKGAKDRNIPFAVFKLTGYARFDLLNKINSKQTLTAAENEEYKRVYERVDKMCAKAAELNQPIFIDAEETWIQDPIDDIAYEMMKKYNSKQAIVYNTIQLYRWDRLAYLKELKAKAENESFKIGLKLVRGAYLEKERERAAKMGYEDPMQKTKENTDKDFDIATKFCFDNINLISFCCATHNEKSTQYLAQLMKENNHPNNEQKICFAQLLGMSDHISMNMAKLGYNVAKYVPYGPVKEVIPYLIRRAEENTSIAGQTGRELSLIIKEKKRRKI